METAALVVGGFAFVLRFFVFDIRRRHQLVHKDEDEDKDNGSFLSGGVWEGGLPTPFVRVFTSA
jgi:hypothetical protein